MPNLLEKERIPNQGLSDRNMPESVYNLLPTGEFHPLEKRMMYLSAQGVEPSAMEWVLDLTPEQLAEHQAHINTKLIEDEKAATAMSFMSLLNSIHPLQNGQNGRREFNLSLREKEVFSMVASGYNSSEIGDKLCISPKTVDNHRENILREMGAKKKAEAILTVLSAVSPDERDRFFPSVKKTTLPEKLSEKEQEILTYLVQGKTSTEISELLNIAPKTADNHRANIIGKFGTDNMTSAITKALTTGLVPI